MIESDHYKIVMQRGEALMSLLVSMTLFALVLVGATRFIFSSTRGAYDLEKRNNNIDNTRKVFDLISRELRVAGSSVPLGQSNFDPSDATLLEAPLGVLTSSDAESISFRINEKGRISYLTASYSPSISSLSFQVNNSEDLFDGEEVYISDMPVGGDNGMRGVITGISGNTVSISATYQTLAGVVFPIGSMVVRSMPITYSNDGDSISRTDSAGSVILAPRASISFTYLDQEGNTLAPPLTSAIIANSLSAVRVNIISEASNVQHNGELFTTNLDRVISLRSMIIGRS